MIDNRALYCPTCSIIGRCNNFIEGYVFNDNRLNFLVEHALKEDRFSFDETGICPTCNGEYIIGYSVTLK